MNLLLVLLLTLVPNAVLSDPQDDGFMADCVCGVEPVKPMIHNGRPSARGSYPWMVYLSFMVMGRLRLTTCAGTIINDRFIMTAAHCVEAPEPLILSALTGIQLGVWVDRDLDLNHLKLEDSLEIKRVIKHANYLKDQATRMTDVALIELEHPLKFNDSFSPICLPDFTDFDNLVAAGWGFVDMHGTEPERLMEAEMLVVSDDVCQQIYLSLEEHEMCAGDEFSNVCPGDSGGPLMTRKQGVVFQAGITTAGTAISETDCGLTQNPAIFEKVTSHLPWIWNETSGAKWCVNPLESRDEDDL